MKKTLAILLSSGLFKAALLIQSSVIIWQAGPAAYAEFGYYILFAQMASTLFTVGVVPVYIRNLAEKEIGKAHAKTISLGGIRQFVVIGLCVLVLVTSSLDVIGFFEDRRPVPALVLSASIGLISILVPIIVLRGFYFPIIASSLLYLFGVTGSAFMFPFLSPGIYLVLFCSVPAGLAIFLAVVYVCYSVPISDLDLFPIAPKKIWAASREIAPVFFPNVFWMAMFFAFTHRVNQWAPTPDIFSWYAIGLLMFGVLVYAPNTLAPIFLRNIVKFDISGGHRYSLLASFTLILFSLIVVLGIWGTLELTNWITLPSEAIPIWRPLLLAGCIGAGFSPLTAFLVQSRNAMLIIIGAISWTFTAHIWFSIAPDQFAMAYLAGFLMALISLIATTLFVTKRGLSALLANKE